MKDFNIAKYLRENYLGSHAILGNYVDLHALKEEEETKLDTEIPYEGPERKVDGFGDKFKQTNAVEEVDEPPFGMPDKSEENPWMDEVDGTAAYKFGNWTCYYDYPGVLAWSYKDVPLNKLAVYATPDWESDGTTPIQIDIDEETQDKMTLKQSEFADFNEYATAMKPYLDRIEDLESDFGSLAPVDEGMNDDDSVNPFPSLMPDEQGKFDRMMGLIDTNIEPRLGQIKSIIDGSREQGYADRTIFTVLARHPLVRNSIEALVDDGFEFQDIVDFFATDFSQNEEIAGYDAGVQMEGSEEYTVDFGTNTMTYTLDRDNSVLRGLKPGIVPGADREEDIIPVTISPEGYLSTSDRRIKDISPKSNKNPFSDPSYRNID